jgi:hypothetical protein
MRQHTSSGGEGLSNLLGRSGYLPQMANNNTPQLMDMNMECLI